MVFEIEGLACSDEGEGSSSLAELELEEDEMTEI